MVIRYRKGCRRCRVRVESFGTDVLRISEPGLCSDENLGVVDKYSIEISMFADGLSPEAEANQAGSRNT